MPGFLGPHTAEEWIEQVHGDQPIACHMTITEADAEGDGDWTHPKIRQCAGAAQYRRNVAKKPRFPTIAVAAVTDAVNVFATPIEFLNHHLRRVTLP